MATATETLHGLIEQLFQPGANPRPDGSMGAEFEVIPIRNRSLRRVPIHATQEGPGTADIARDAARLQGWEEETDDYGAPRWNMPDGGRLCYEPGGQFEIISPVFASASDLSIHLRNSLRVLRASAASADVQLLALGIDPYNTIDTVALELHAPRYDVMTAYFNGIGESGVRMMRQTASVHVSVELGPNVMQRWELLNSLAPYLIAMFANSDRYGARSTGYASYRAHQWQTLDPGRTGLPFDAVDPVGAYARFARHAGRILSEDSAHLTTLFPEIRPRGYFEIRSLDSMEPDRIDAALQFISRIVHDPDTASAALRIIGPPDSSLLSHAALNGRSDPLLKPRIDLLERLVAEASRIDPR
ncbi:MAG: glutamate-cysteine ligase family protein [Gemmatimonadaceae bacterium]